MIVHFGDHWVRSEEIVRWYVNGETLRICLRGGGFVDVTPEAGQTVDGIGESLCTKLAARERSE